MRVFSFLVLLVVVVAVVIFAVQNNEAITLHYLDRSVTVPLAALIAVVYFLGMVSGWSVLGFLRRSVRRVTESRER